MRKFWSPDPKERALVRPGLQNFLISRAPGGVLRELRGLVLHSALVVSEARLLSLILALEVLSPLLQEGEHPGVPRPRHIHALNEQGSGLGVTFSKGA
jgi:hypothetical protein